MNNFNDRLPNLEVKTYGSDDNKIKVIEGILKLSSWSGYQSRQGIYDSIDTDKQSDGTVRVQIGGDMVVDNPEVAEEHVNAYKYLIEHQHKLKDIILNSLFINYKKLQEQYGYEIEEEKLLMPDIDNTSQFKNLIGLSSVHLLNVSKDNVAYVGYEFGCTWDDEHGLGVMTYKDRIVEIGNADSSFLTWIAEEDLESNTE